VSSPEINIYSDVWDEKKYLNKKPISKDSVYRW